MVTPAMQQQQPQTIYGPNGERADWNGREYVLAAPAATAAPAGGGYQLQPMVTPAEQRAREEREYDRSRDAERDARLDRNEERQVGVQERLARTEERAVAANELTTRGGTPELRGRLALGLGPSVRAVDSMAAQHEGVNPLNRDWGATLIDDIPDWGLLSAAARVVGGQDYQDYNQSLKTVESSLLPIFSGMAVTPTEAQRFMKANQPQLGDSPETIQRKTQNVQIILNEGAHLAGRPIPYPEAGRYGEEGFRELLATGDAGSVSAPLIGGAAKESAGGGPQPGDVSVTQQPLAPTDTPNSLSAQGYVYDSGRDIWTRSSQQEVDPEAVKSRAASGRSAQGEGLVRKVDAGVRGAADTLTFGLADEIVAGLNTVAPLDRGSRSLWTEGAGDAFAHNLAMQRGIDSADAQDVPVSRGTGQIAGALVPAARLRGALMPGASAARVAQSGGRIARSARSAGVGAAWGGAYGFGSGEGNALARAPGAGAGAAFGAGGGAASPFVANVLARGAAPVVRGLQAANRAVARPIINAMGETAPAALREAVQPNPLASGLDRLAARSPQRPNALTGEVERYRAEQIDPTFADVINDGGRGTMRALATRQTPARQAAREFADGRAAGLQDRVSLQARRTISDDPRSPDEIRSTIAARRTQEGDAAFGAVRNEMVTPEPAMIAALRTPAGRAAVEDAATRAANRGDIETANGLRQLVEGALDEPSGVQMTVGMADRISRTLNGKAEAARGTPMAPGDNDAAGALFSQAEALRGTARRQVPAYDDALRAYGDDSRLIQASSLGEQFMSMEADQFAAAVARLSPEEQQIARAAARRAVERQAGTQGQAPGVAQRLSNGREQAARTTALVGDAEPVQRAMGAELQTLRNAQGVNPGQGSPTSMNLQDAAGAAGMGRDLATGNVVGLASRAMTAIRSRGFSDAEAEAVVTAAIDPARTDELVRMLAQRMNRREARNLARALRYQFTTGPQSAQQP